jgi:hypothetical protein
MKLQKKVEDFQGRFSPILAHSTAAAVGGNGKHGNDTRPVSRTSRCPCWVTEAPLPTEARTIRCRMPDRCDDQLVETRISGDIHCLTYLG